VIPILDCRSLGLSLESSESIDQSVYLYGTSFPSKSIIKSMHSIPLCIHIVAIYEGVDNLIDSK
jgi:hypothetical protein